MADSRLRARERAWREAGDFASEGMWTLRLAVRDALLPWALAGTSA